MTKINNIVGNPPYNGPETGRPPIYHELTELQRMHVDPDTFAWIVQYNWLTQLNPVGQLMRQSLIKMGVFLIEDNRFEGFTKATVRTCTIYCRRGYTGNITISDRIYNQSIAITPQEFKDSKVLPIYSQAERDLIVKLSSASVDANGIPQNWIATGILKHKDKEYPTPAIAVTYFADFINGGVGKLRRIGPGVTTLGTDRLFKGYDNLGTVEDADVMLERMNSFWHSNLVKFILSRTLTSRTLDNPQIAQVPVVPMDRVWTDAALAQYFNLTPAEQIIINSVRLKQPLVYQPNNTITEAIGTAAIKEGAGREIFRTAGRKDENGEVFTPTALVLHLLTKLDTVAWTAEQTFLDPTCGNGQILATIAVVKRELGHTNYLATIYGTDLMEDNVNECRERLLAIAGDTPENRAIVNNNIQLGNAREEQTYQRFAETKSLFEWS